VLNDDEAGSIRMRNRDDLVLEVPRLDGGDHWCLKYGRAISAVAVLVALLVRRPTDARTAAAESVRETVEVGVGAPGASH
jgi:hypothetical protein